MAGKRGALARLDLSLELTPSEEQARLVTAQERLLQLRLVLGGLIGRDPRIGPPVCVVFEGWDASGKGGAIKRLVGPLDPRHVRVAQFGAPSYDEKRHHFLWRFWPVLPGWGGMAVLDRSWYGRVLVERVEGFATEEQWPRAYAEIVEFERTLAAEGMIMIKFWMHLSSAEQLRRFKAREQDPLKTWKLTAEDWRNRGKRRLYKAAVEDMLDRTDHAAAPWVLVEAEDKRWARVKVVESVVAAIESGMAARNIPIPPPPPPPRPPPPPPPRPLGNPRRWGLKRARIPELPVQAQTKPGEVAGKLPRNAPEEAEPFSCLLADLESIVVPGVTQVQHPRYFGWFPANSTLSSALGDLASAGIGALGITWQSAPALTEVEEVVVEWLRDLTALPGSWKGVIQDTASSACLVALLAARERATDFSEVRGGLQAETAPLTVYTTEHAHSSIPKAVVLAGYGRGNLRFVDVDPVTYAMRPEALASALEADVAAGRRPAAVVVSVGTTGTTAVDPLA